MNRRRTIILLACVFYALQLLLLLSWYGLATNDSRSLDLVITIVVAVCFAAIDAGVVRYLLGFLKRSESAYAADVSMQLERSLEDYRATAEREQALAREVGKAVDEELTRARAALAEGRAEETSAHLHEGLDIASRTHTVYCDNVPIAAVLETKERQCADAGIRFEHNVDLPEELPLPEVDIAAVFFNLIDNAMHECQALVAEADGLEVELSETPTVAVQSMIQASQLYVQVDNPCRKNTKKAKRMRREKSLAHEHGWGSEIVERIAEAHGGIADLSRNGDTFTARVMIPLPTSRTK